MGYNRQRDGSSIEYPWTILAGRLPLRVRRFWNVMGDRSTVNASALRYRSHEFAFVVPGSAVTVYGERPSLHCNLTPRITPIDANEIAVAMS